MAYSAGNTILDDEYNIFATGNANGTQNNTNGNVNTVMATGAGDRGYGQTAVTAVTAGTTVSATQWATLLNKISSAAAHQGTSITSITNPVSTNTIVAESALAGNVTSITTNRLNAAASGTPITAGGVSSSAATWNGTVNTTQTVTFASADAMRYFFNAGGRITVAYSRTGGTAAAKNTGWSNLCTACGTINLTGAAGSKTIAATAYTGTTKIGGSGTPTILLTATGADALTGTPVAIFRQYDSSTSYTANYITLNASKTSTVVTLQSVFQDDADANTDENIDGTLSVTVTVVPPSTANLTSTWGTPTINTTEAL
jgi:hypothetical protein